MTGAEGAAQGLQAGGKAAAMELIDVIFEWIVPLIALIVGFAMSPAIGLSGAIGTLVDGALGESGITTQVMAYISDFIAIVIWAAIAAGCWAMREKAGEWGSYILRPVAALFGGLAIGEAPNLFKGTVSNGALGKMADGIHLGA